MDADRRRFLQLLAASSVVGCDESAAPSDREDSSTGSSSGSHADDASSDATGAPPLPELPEPDDPAATARVFAHGIASGDPFETSVLLWTRITTGLADAALTWEVALDPGFAEIVASGTATATAADDHCVTLEADGLEPGTTYYYRFAHAGVASKVGRTKTVPSGDVPLRFAVCSCSSLAHGWFHVYRRIAERDDIDAVIHLGDYIYEYASGDYGDVRAYDPPHEIITLDDYRRRYRHYRSDPDLQEAHRRHPFITTWDDHESANNSYKWGAQNHDSQTEGPWSERLAGARKAYFEYLPLRDWGDGDRVYRYVRYGTMAELIVLDTRLEGRDEQAWGETDNRLWDADRRLVGAEQESFLLERLQQTPARWKLICQQVMFAPRPHQSEIATDTWEGYPVQRARVYDAVAASSDVVVLTGDVHSSWANDVSLVPGDPGEYDAESGAGSIAVELVTPAISSAPWKPDQAARTYERIAASSPHVKYVELTRNGYMVLRVEALRVTATWWFVEDVTREDGGTEQAAPSLEVRAGERSLRRS
jgi:alkaline phosphatase D